MDNKIRKYIKAFICLSRQNYFPEIKNEYKTISDKVMFGNFDSQKCGCEYEAAMEWIIIKGSQDSPRLGVFSEAFKIFEDHKDLFDELKKLHDKTFSSDEFCRLLLKLGYKDLSDNKLE